MWYDYYIFHPLAEIWTSSTVQKDHPNELDISHHMQEKYIFEDLNNLPVLKP